MQKTLIFCCMVMCCLFDVDAAIAQFQGGDSGVGYIDSAVVRNQVRFRFDASYDSPAPYRAEFFYPKSRGLIAGIQDPLGPGLPLSETKVDYQEFSLFAETLLYSDLISGFVEVPFRLINPEVNANSAGISDINFGVKAALIATETSFLTLQFRTFVPTGDGSRGLGTENVVLEPGVLFFQQLRNGTLVEGEVRDIIPVDGTDWAGNVLRYGIGVSHPLIQTEDFSWMPVWETVAWSVLGGRVGERIGTPNERVTDAETTIVNMKFGSRFNIARRRGEGFHSTYVGYGRSISGNRWYQDTLRLEYRLSF